MDAVEVVPSAKMTLIACALDDVERGEDLALGVDDEAAAEVLGLRRAACTDSITTSPARRARYTVAATGGWDWSWEIAAFTFWLTMLLTSFELTAGRRKIVRSVTPRATTAATSRTTAPRRSRCRIRNGG